MATGMDWLALDVGGANLKAADGRGYGDSRPFALWQQPQQLAAQLADLLADAPRREGVALTMTGELADCYRTKAEGVRAIVAATCAAAESRPVRVYLTSGELVAPDDARERPLAAAASNWHALARFAARLLGGGRGLSIDVGSTTTDVIPIVDGWPQTAGATDPERLAAGELLYTGVARSPLCGLVHSLPWRGQSCPVALEWFATTGDVYCLLGHLPENSHATHTADGRPATREFAHERLARMVCADRELFDVDDARAAAVAVEAAQREQLTAAIERQLLRLGDEPMQVVVSGQGEFLARRAVAACRRGGVTSIVSLNEQLGPMLSQCATAHALAVLAREGAP